MSYELDLSCSGNFPLYRGCLDLSEELLELPPSPLSEEDSVDEQILDQNEVLAQKLMAQCPEVGIEHASQILEKIQSARALLSSSETFMLQASPSFPYDIYVNGDFFQIIRGKVGEGTFGEVRNGPIISFGDADPISDQPTDMVRKVNIRPNGPGFSPVKRCVDHIRGNVSPKKQRSIASYTHTSRLTSGHATAIMDHYQGRHLVDTKFKSARDLIHKLGLLANALEGYHANGFIHRDVKEANILNTENFPVLIDPDLISDPNKVRWTHGTPEYLDPRAFGSPEQSLINQRLRVGQQNSSGDIYAFSIVGLNCVRRYLNKNISHRQGQNELHKVLEMLRPTYVEASGRTGKFSDDELRVYGTECNHRAFFWPGSSTQRERIGVYPQDGFYRNAFHAVLSSARIPDSEKRLLWDFVNLCLELKAQPADQRYSAAQIYEISQNILGSEAIATKEANSVAHLSGNKRRRQDFLGLENKSPRTSFSGQSKRS
ncbi:hypothetical protein [Simkania sp.]|uniref:hypothetical protein n=1 Tax=Simkania sp. TaxID=34094 RepID=UPI003B52A019